MGYCPRHRRGVRTRHRRQRREKYATNACSSPLAVDDSPSAEEHAIIARSPGQRKAIFRHIPHYPRWQRDDVGWNGDGRCGLPAFTVAALLALPHTSPAPGKLGRTLENNTLRPKLSV